MISSSLRAKIIFFKRISQQSEPASDIEPLKAEIENFSRKKRKAIDIMLDELLSREALKKEVDYYDSEIAKLTQEISDRISVPYISVSSIQLKNISGRSILSPSMTAMIRNSIRSF